MRPSLFASSERQAKRKRLTHDRANAISNRIFRQRPGWKAIIEQRLDFIARPAFIFDLDHLARCILLRDFQNPRERQDFPAPLGLFARMSGRIANSGNIDF